jgi:pimeloyl-ACP methyl ester carboxylesterase
MLVYLGFILLLALFQRSFIYFPSRGTEAELLTVAKASGILPWRDATGELIGWKSAPRAGESKNRWLVFHGNVGQAVHRDYFIDGFTAFDDGRLWEVFVLEYPGYGTRDGKPTETALLGAAEAALKQLQQDDKRPVYLLGESLGSGVASALAARHQDAIAGVFLITPFTSMTAMAARQYPFVPVRLLLRDRYESDVALKTYHGPLAILIAGRDSMVPAQFGRSLHDEYAGRKRIWVQQHADHNSLDYQPDAKWWREVSDFLLQRSGPAS